MLAKGVTKTSKYEIISNRDELPKYADIEAEVEDALVEAKSKVKCCFFF